MRVSHTTQRRLLLRFWAARPLRAPLTRRSLVTATEAAATQRRAFGMLTQPLAPSHKNGTPILEDPGISMSEIREIAATSPTPMTLQQMKTFADGTNKTRLISANFLHKELQIRFARAVVELSELPLGLAETEAIQRAMRVYCHSIHSIRSVRPPTNVSEELAFTEAIRKAKENGANLVPLICGGLKELASTDLGRNTLKFDAVQEDLMHRLDTFFLARIGIRMLIGQHVESMVQVGGRVELVNVAETVRSACDRAANLCRLYCGTVPEVEIKLASKLSAPFTYVESHLHHMVFELVKNAMRATVELHNDLQNSTKPRPVHKFESVMDPNSRLLGFVMPDFTAIDGITIYPDTHKYGRSGELPAVEVVVYQGHEDLTIKVSDNGGGVKRSDWHKLWHYGYTTSSEFPPKESYGYHSFREHFSGGGYGLPMARLFARYFGGEVTFTSLEGYGSSVFIQAHRLGRKTEMVPGHASFSLQPLYS